MALVNVINPSKPVPSMFNQSNLKKGTYDHKTTASRTNGPLSRAAEAPLPEAEKVLFAGPDCFDFRGACFPRAWLGDASAASTGTARRPSHGNAPRPQRP